MQADEKILHTVDHTERMIASKLREIDELIDKNTWRTLRAFQNHRVSDYHFLGSTGYGYNDRGRETLDSVYAEVFGAEAGLVRPHFASGTHAIATSLFGILRPGDELMFLNGAPYDTLHKVIGQYGDGTGSLRDWGIHCTIIPLTVDDSVDWFEAEKAYNPRIKVVAIQRSRGYTWRSACQVEEIKTMVERIKSWNREIIVFLDNCYGEFTEDVEPTDKNIGVDLMAGSLIKNPGGGLALSGGYIVGRKHLVELASYRLTAPGIGAEVGAMMGTTRSIFQGLFMAPHIVGQALKGAVFTAAMFESCGFAIHPHWNDTRSDIIQAIKFHSKNQLVSFVQNIQRASAIDAHAVPEPWDMPGYNHQVIMAAGTFIQGGSLELSADAPIREPYIAFLQGGLTYSHVKIGVITALQSMKESGLL
jgi:cystathionine beta-lyase family protein involved in aluminum resistance